MKLTPSHPRLGRWAYRLARPWSRTLTRRAGLHTADSELAQANGRVLRQKLARGETVWLVGLGIGGHNAGASLVAVHPTAGVRMVGNHEEERFRAHKHYADYPALALDCLREQMSQLGLRPRDIHAYCASWDYSELIAHSARTFAEEVPHNWPLLIPQRRDTFLTDYRVVLEALSAPRRLAAQWNLPLRQQAVWQLRHHDNHAWFSWAASPFAHSEKPVMIAVVDGSGDDGSLSLYVAHHGRVQCVYHNGAMFDSLGTFYSVISATQGGWTPLSSEGRYMGAAAWGDYNRESNPYYAGLRRVLGLLPDGEVRLNRQLANWQRGGYVRPYTRRLQSLLGPPIPPSDFWNPDRVLRVSEIGDKHPPETVAHLNKAAATQLVLEDALVHVVEAFVRRTGSHQLVLTGGVALNCTANSHLLTHFDEAFYARELGQKETRLQLWVPPVAGDAGTVVGAAFHWALAHGARPSPEPLPHAFYCGLPPRGEEITAVLATSGLNVAAWGNINQRQARRTIAAKLAQIVAAGHIIGLFQGVAETGPRALGHRSFIANPCLPQIRQVFNQHIKHRERIRPLAPLMTLGAARAHFDLLPGTGAGQYHAYNFMTLTAQAKPHTREAMPGIVHRDGSSRVQIVRAETDPLTHDFLVVLGTWIGFEVAVNTSLNVGTPIVQTPTQAVQIFARARGLAGLLLVDGTGAAWYCWPQG